jgi:lipopolysaccharide export system permease protein
MKINLYLARTVISAIFMVLVVFLGLILFVNLLGEIGATGSGNYTFFDAVKYTLLYLPLVLYQIFPMIVLIGVLVGLGTLASHNELTICRTSGMPLISIAMVVITAALVVTIVVTLIGEGFAPGMARYADKEKSLEKNNGQVISTLSGIWVRDSNDFFHIATISQDNKVTGVTFFEFSPQHELLQASRAAYGVFQNNAWQFHQITTSKIFPDHVERSTQDTASWPLRFNFHQFTHFDPHLISLLNLKRQINFGLQNGSNVSSYQITFWMRILQPLTTIIMVLVAIPFIFGPLRSVGMGLRLLSGIMVGLVFFILNQFVMSFGLAYQIAPLLAAALLPCIFLVFSMFLFWWKG